MKRKKAQSNSDGHGHGRRCKEFAGVEVLIWGWSCSNLDWAGAGLELGWAGEANGSDVKSLQGLCSPRSTSSTVACQKFELLF